MSQSRTLYSDKTRNPLAGSVELDEGQLRAHGRIMPLVELNLVAMADAYLRGRWLGGGGTERALAAIGPGAGVVPVIRVSGSAMPVKVRRAAEFAAALGELSVRMAGGRDVVAGYARLAAQEGVPLWIARRITFGPTGGPIAVAVDRRLARADVWAPDVASARLRGPLGLRAGQENLAQLLAVTIGSAPAALAIERGWRKSQRSVTVHSPVGRWELRRETWNTSRLLRDGGSVALLGRPDRRRALTGNLRPLADVQYHTSYPVDAVLAHFFGACFGLGDDTGRVRFGMRRPKDDGEIADSLWEEPWFTGLGKGSADNGPGGSADGWFGDGGGEGGGGDGGGDGGGGDGGGGGGE
ncbi:hypothetical protein [Streptomyces millisiae]|uniref:Aromatic ring-opening dioxygenase LigA n=1 Tax=Streptomyces millisiae TaxID=3075542 RepID=A0ABU2LKE3_9ACTN|nr:hypothetical protein [Streptomyces sp. DSM 44918]MDT0318054.1 hypothetical protein [Streptomyces sp. DSM 44918]